MRRTFVILLLAHCANDSIGQSTPVPAPPTVLVKPESSGDVRFPHLPKAAHHLPVAGIGEKAHRTHDLAAKDRQLHDELHKQLALRDSLTREIQRLRRLTGEHEQVVVYVTVSEVSLTKVRESDVIIDGVDTKLLKRSGIGGVLHAGILGEHEETETTKYHANGNKTIGFRVIEREELLSDLVTVLQSVGALQVLAEPVLATISGRPASLHAGGEFPVLVPQTNGQAIEYQKFGTQLHCVPTALGNGRIRLELRPRISEIDTNLSTVMGDVSVPGFRVRALNFAVEMNVGQTLVLAGFLQERAAKRPVFVSTPSDAATKQSGEVLDPAHEPSTEPNENPIEEVELVITVRTEILDVPKTAGRVGAE